MTYRIKEVLIPTREPSTWFYPEQQVIETITTGWLWKKKTQVETWERFFNLSYGVVRKSEKETDELSLQGKQNVIAFKTLIEAQEWIKLRLETEEAETDKLMRNWYKFVGSTIDEKKELVKIHEIK